jgi:Dicer dimerisation domain
MKMPSDCFTNINVLWRRVDIIKEEIISDPQVNVKLAKQHAAFKACLKLYELGELNENLVPVDEKQKVETVEAEYFGHSNQRSYERHQKSRHSKQ